MSRVEIDFPYRPAATGRTATSARDDHVRDLIEQLLWTAPGERVMRPDFGCGIPQLIFAPNSPELAAAVQFTTVGALQRWLRDVIDVSAVEVTSDDAVLHVVVRYVVLRSGEVRSDHFERSVS